MIDSVKVRSVRSGQGRVSDSIVVRVLFHMIRGGVVDSVKAGVLISWG